MSKEVLQNVMVVGSGGREHALGWKLRQSPHINKLYFAPGNGGTEKIGDNIPIGAEEIDKLIQFAVDKRIDLTIVGPEVPLAKSIVNQFQEEKSKIFGPTKEVAQLESSKVWQVRFMERHNIPHPYSEIYADPDEAKVAIKKSQGRLMVVKADGLAAGKGVVVSENEKEAIEAVDNIMVKKTLGLAGEKVVLQEKLEGQEVSFISFVDGKNFVPMLPAQDHKRLLEDDLGPNTGGMGAYAPVPKHIFSSEMFQRTIKKIIEPTVKGMWEEENPFKGALYAGLMITKEGPKVLEFNVRFGDPETQPIMMLMKSDLLPILHSCVNGTLKKEQVIFSNKYAVCIVLASKGYPGKYQTGYEIHELDQDFGSDVEIFHAGTKKEKDILKTSGGRVLSITACGTSLKTALNRANNVAKKSFFEEQIYRKDIAKKVFSL